MKREICKICRKKAKFEEWSPDGLSDFFCSVKHHREYLRKMHKKGLIWRATPLKKIKDVPKPPKVGRNK